MPGFVEELASRTGVECEMLNPFREVDTAGGFEQRYLEELAPIVSVAAGLALREPGDKGVMNLEDEE